MLNALTVLNPLGINAKKIKELVKLALISIPRVYMGESIVVERGDSSCKEGQLRKQGYVRGTLSRSACGSTSTMYVLFFHKGSIKCA